MTYGKILTEIHSTLSKEAFIPSPTGGQSAGGQAGGQSPQQDPQQMMAQLSQMAQSQGGQQGGGSPQPGQDPSQAQGQDPTQQGQQDPNQPQDPNAPPGGDLTPKGMSKSLQETPVTLSVAELIDLVSGGKASQSHLKTESMKVQHGFKHREMLRKEQEKQQQNEQQRQEQEAMQQAQQQGMMGGGIYSQPMDGPTAPGQPGKPEPRSMNF